MRQDRLNSKDQTAELPSVVEVAAALAELYSQPTPHSLSTAAEAGAESSHGGSTSIALPASLPSRQKRAPSDIEHWGWVDPAGQAPNINNSSTTPSQRRALLLPSRSNLVNVCRSDATGAMRVYESAVHLAAFLEDRFSNSLAPLEAWCGVGSSATESQQQQPLRRRARPRRVLELGAGLGFVGLSLARSGCVDHVTMTDKETLLMDVVKTNIDIDAAFGPPFYSCHCQRLRWGSEEDIAAVLSGLQATSAARAPPHSEVIDTIVAADVLYHSPEAVEALVETIRRFGVAFAEKAKTKDTKDTKYGSTTLLHTFEAFVAWETRQLHADMAALFLRRSQEAGFDIEVKRFASRAHSSEGEGYASFWSERCSVEAASSYSSSSSAPAQDGELNVAIMTHQESRADFC